MRRRFRKPLCRGPLQDTLPRAKPPPLQRSSAECPPQEALAEALCRGTLQRPSPKALFRGPLHMQRRAVSPETSPHLRNSPQSRSGSSYTPAEVCLCCVQVLYMYCTVIVLSVQYFCSKCAHLTTLRCTRWRDGHAHVFVHLLIM